MRMAAAALALCVAMPSLARAQGPDDPIAACDVPEIRLALGLDDPDWAVACDAGIVGAVRVRVDEEGAVGATLAWRGEGAQGRTDLVALLEPEERRLYSQLVDVRFLPNRGAYRRLSIVTQEGEDYASRVEHQVWFRVGADGRWVVAFAGRVDGSVHVNGLCHHTWRARLSVRGRWLGRRWRHAQSYDGDDAPGARACAEEGASIAPRRTRLRRVVLEPGAAEGPTTAPGRLQ